jgi:hypothetical protein
MGTRDQIVSLCERYLPETTDRNSYFHWHQIGFDSIAKDYGQGSGTTCGFLPHWLLWRIGCSDANLVNRSVPEQGFKWRTGENLSIFGKHASCVRVDGPLATQMANNTGGPRPGDFVIIRGGFWKNPDTGVRDRDSAHIFVLLEVKKADGKEVQWRVAQTGVSNDALQQGGHIMTLTGKLKQETVKEGNTDVKGPNLVFIANIRGEEAEFPRRVTSYTNVEALAYGATPNGMLTQLLDSRRNEQTKNDPKTVYPFLGWYEETSPGGFITTGPTYIVLERGHEATRFSRQGLGSACTLDTSSVWTRTGDRLAIQWREGRRQSWDVKKSWVPKEQVTGTPVDGNGGTLNWVKKMPTEVPAKWANAHFIG